MNHAEFDFLINKAKGVGLSVSAYPNQWLINIIDSDGVTQSYYTTTGTAIFRDGNDKYKSKKKTLRDFSYDKFITLCKGDGDEDILDFFEED